MLAGPADAADLLSEHALSVTMKFPHRYATMLQISAHPLSVCGTPAGTLAGGHAYCVVMSGGCRHGYAEIQLMMLYFSMINTIYLYLNTAMY